TISFGHMLLGWANPSAPSFDCTELLKVELSRELCGGLLLDCVALLWIYRITPPEPPPITFAFMSIHVIGDHHFFVCHLRQLMRPASNCFLLLRIYVNT